MMIEFRTLGTLDLRRSDGSGLDSLLAQPKRIALLSYLCLATPHGFHRRDTLLGLFWPDSDQSRARNSLRAALHVLRHAIGEDAFTSRGDEEIAANRDAIWCDVVAFEQRLAAKQFVEALELYRGELLPGFFLDEVPMFDRWLEGERARLRSLAARAARLAAETRESDQNLTDAVHWARRAAELTDSDERAVRRLVELLARAGDRAGALQVYDDFAGRLASELDAEPSAETRALAEKLRSARSSAEPPGARPPEASNGNSIHHGRVQDGYQIEREIGRGGTAVVFLAGDVKHGRNVALKVLRPEIAAVLGTQRFLAEIAITARLNHPNIVTLLDSGEIEGAPFYTMPFVAGETLRARLQRERTLDIADAIRIVRDVAEALSHAHGHGIVHRDVKPENILFDNGRALVTDFGIARAITEAANPPLTQPGLAIGTAAYMSPEQADGGRDVDARTDVYSLACVLYEMLTGDPPFTGSSKQAILARKLAEPVPPLRNVRDSVTPGLEEAILKALSRTPGDRFPTVKAFADALHSPVASRRSWLRSRRTVSATVAGLVTLAAVVVLGNVAASPTPPPPERKRITFNGSSTLPALSPDGQFLAYQLQGSDSSRVVVQDLTGGPPDTIFAFIRGTIAHTMEWSPNGARLLLKIPGKTLILHRRGGRPEIVGSFRPADQPHWLPDGSRISLSNLMTGRLLIVNPGTGDSLALRIPLVNSQQSDGAWSRDFVFAVATHILGSARWTIHTIRLDGRVQTLVEDSVSLNSPRWSPDGDVLYYLRGGDAVWRVNVSRRTGRIAGAPTRVESGIDAVPLSNPMGHFSVSGDGHKLVYAKGVKFSNIYRVHPGRSTSSPRMERLTTGTTYRWSPVISPDGAWIAYGAMTQEGSEIFRMPLAGGADTAITTGARVQPGSEIAWSPDGSFIAFQSVREGTSRLWIATVATGELRQFTEATTSILGGFLTWAPGSRIAYKTPRAFIRLLDPATGKDELLVRDTSDAWFHMPRYSPDGRELAMLRWKVPEKNLISVLRIEDHAERRIATGFPPAGMVFLRGWSADGRYILAQVPFKPTVIRIDVRGQNPPDTVFTAPVRDLQCAPEPRRNDPSFVCAVIDVVSDVWMIENFDRSK